jgi:hypothetical protein
MSERLKIATCFAAVALYAIVAFTTFGYEANRVGERRGHHSSSGDIGSGAVAGVLWPFYWPLRWSYLAWQPYWSEK